MRIKQLIKWSENGQNYSQVFHQSIPSVNLEDAEKVIEIPEFEERSSNERFGFTAFIKQGIFYIPLRSVDEMTPFMNTPYLSVSGPLDSIISIKTGINTAIKNFRELLCVSVPEDNYHVRYNTENLKIPTKDFKLLNEISIILDNIPIVESNGVFYYKAHQICFSPFYNRRIETNRALLISSLNPFKEYPPTSIPLSYIHGHAFDEEKIEHVRSMFYPDVPDWGMRTNFRNASETVVNRPALSHPALLNVENNNLVMAAKCLDWHAKGSYPWKNKALNKIHNWSDEDIQLFSDNANFLRNFYLDIIDNREVEERKDFLYLFVRKHLEHVDLSTDLQQHKAAHFLHAHLDLERLDSPLIKPPSYKRFTL